MIDPSTDLASPDDLPAETGEPVRDSLVGAAEALLLAADSTPSERAELMELARSRLDELTRSIDSGPSDLGWGQVTRQPIDTTPTRPILEALRAGLADATAARECNMSVRTYRRHVAHMMHRLGARTRFEAGYLAKARRWI